MLYETIKSKQVFKHLAKIKKNDSIVENSLNIDGLDITQDNLNALIEYEKIESLLNKLEEKNITDQDKYIINHTLDAIKEIRV